MVADTQNLTEQCDFFGEVNRTGPLVSEQLDAAGCLFRFILPQQQVVPLVIWIFVLLTFFSFLVNGGTLFGLERCEDLSWEPRVAFLKNLIYSDLIQTVTIAPSVIHSLVQRRTIVFGIWCQVQYFVGTVSIFSSLLTITCMALERYLYVCHAIRYLSMLTQVRLRLALVLIWVYSILTGSINMVLLYTGKEQNGEPVIGGLLCEPDMVEQQMGFPRAAAIFRKIIGPITLLMCLMVYAFSYLRMYQDAQNAMIPFNTVNTAACRTVLFYCGMLFLQLLPLFFKVMSDSLWELEGTTAMMAPSSAPHRHARPPPSETAVVLHLSLAVMLLVPPCINPLVYGLKNVETREALLSPFRWWTKRRARE